MLLDFEKTCALIESGKLLHIAGTEKLLKKLPKGNWVGGSTEYFVGEDGGIITDEKLFVSVLPFDEYKCNVYDFLNIKYAASDAYDNGLALLIIPFDSDVHTEYARNAPEYDDMFIKPVVGWISGTNLGKSGQTPLAVNGFTGECFDDEAVALFIKMPEGKRADIKTINIFSEDENSPVIRFKENGFAAAACLVDGKETNFSDYIAKEKIDTNLPLVGSYSGTGVNVSIKNIEDPIVHFYAPVFSDIDYRFAKAVPDYEAAFASALEEIDNMDSVFACNCILNFLYGNLEGKKIDGLYGAVTFGEIAWQLLNQTLVYVTIE